MKVYATGSWSRDYTWNSHTTKWELNTDDANHTNGIHSLIDAYAGKHEFYDWASVKHNALPKEQQIDAIHAYLLNCDIFLINLDGYEDRAAGASVFQYAMAWALGKRIVVVDGLKNKRAPSDRGNVIAFPTTFNHLYGFSLLNKDRVQWVESIDQVTWI